MKKSLLILLTISLLALSACSKNVPPANTTIPQVSTKTTSESESSQLTDQDFIYIENNQQEIPMNFGYYYGFTQNQSVVFKLSSSYSKDRTTGSYTLPRNLTLQSSIEDFVDAYDIQAQNSVVQVWKLNMSHFYKFDIKNIDEFTKGAEWADLVIAWYKIDEQWHQMTSQEVMDLMSNKWNEECEAVYTVSIDCSNPSQRNSVIITYTTLEDWVKFNR